MFSLHGSEVIQSELLGASLHYLQTALMVHWSRKVFGSIEDVSMKRKGKGRQESLEVDFKKERL